MKHRLPFIPDYEAIRPRAVLLIEVNGKRFYASLEDSPAAKAFIEKLNSAPLAVDMHNDGHFRMVGALPWSLPQSDGETAVEPGDLLLCGDGIAICYAEKECVGTRPARIGSVTKEKLLDAFGAGTARVEFSLEWGE